MPTDNPNAMSYSDFFQEDQSTPRDLSTSDITEMLRTYHNAANDLLLNYLESQPRYEPVLLDSTPCKNGYDTIHGVIAATPWMRLSQREDVHIERVFFLMLDYRIISNVLLIIAQHDVLNAGITQERLDYMQTSLTENAEGCLRGIYHTIDRPLLGVNLSRLPSWLYRRTIHNRVRLINRDEYYIYQF